MHTQKKHFLAIYHFLGGVRPQSDKNHFFEAFPYRDTNTSCWLVVKSATFLDVIVVLTVYLILQSIKINTATVNMVQLLQYWILNIIITMRPTCIGTSRWIGPNGPNKSSPSKLKQSIRKVWKEDFLNCVVRTERIFRFGCLQISTID